MVTPCSVFMTFETEEGYKRALKYDDEVNSESNKDKYGDDMKKWIDGVHEIEIQPASEPSDIIWENRHLTEFERGKRKVIVYTIISVMLFISFIIIFVLQSVSDKAIAKYPIISDCSKLLGYGNERLMQQSATLEYKTNTALEE